MKGKNKISYRRNVNFRSKEKVKPGFFDVDQFYCWLTGAKQPDKTYSSFSPIIYKEAKK